MYMIGNMIFFMGYNSHYWIKRREFNPLKFLLHSGKTFHLSQGNFFTFQYRDIFIILSYLFFGNFHVGLGVIESFNKYIYIIQLK
jgi:hypothetical protein